MSCRKKTFSWWWGMAVVLVLPFIWGCVHGQPIIDPTQACQLCSTLKDPIQQAACRESFCSAATASPTVPPEASSTSVPSPTMTTGPTVTPTVAPPVPSATTTTPPNTPTPSAKPTPSDWAQPVARYDSVTVATTSKFFTDNLLTAQTRYYQAHPERFSGSGSNLVLLLPTLQNEYLPDLVYDLRVTQGLDAIVDGNSGDIAIALVGPAKLAGTFSEQYHPITSGDGSPQHPRKIQQGMQAWLERDEPKWWVSGPIPSGAPAVTPTPTTPPTPTQASKPPAVEVVNGTGRFTLFFYCTGPECTNRSWPCDQDHAGWVPGEPFGPLSPDAGPQQKRMYEICQGRIWDATCGSINNTFVRALPGSTVVGATAERNCYTEVITGSGQWQACLPAGAKACLDPNDYRDDTGASRDTYAPQGHCAHGEVVLTDHDICSPVYTN